MEQSRKKFLKNFFIGATSVPIILEACKKNTDPSSGTGSGSSTCTAAPTETAGPFPTITPSSLVRSNIKDDRSGVPLTMNITIKNTNNSCAVLAGAIVDVWHCDKDGCYSEYGRTGMQTINYQGVHFLRRGQTTHANDLTSFTTILPAGILAEAKPLIPRMRGL